MAVNTVVYHPEAFSVPTVEIAKSIILTNEGPGADTETRWALETPYVLELISQAFDLHPDMLVLDYGCGIGRLAKAMIDASGCRVIGLDISPAMRTMAVDYVGSDRFLAVSPGQFDILVQAGLRAQAAISVWVLQHCFAPAEDIARIQRGLAAGGQGFILNMPKRAIPIKHEDPHILCDWATDQIDVAGLLRAAFSIEAEGEPDKSRVPNMADAGAYWMNFRQKAGHK